MTENVATIKKLREDGAKKDETIRKLEWEIETYKEILLTWEKPSEDMFLIYNNDSGTDSIDIIGRNIREFGELLYKQGHQLIARQESNLEFCIYLASFDNNSNLDESINMIENLIEKKRTLEEENVNNNWPMNRIVPEMKVNNDKLKDIKDETARLQQTLAEFQAQSDAKLNEIKNNYEATLEILQFSLVNKDFIINKFHKQKRLEYIRNSSETLERMCERLSVKHDGDSIDPPFKNTLSMKNKKQDLIGYLELLQKEIDGSTQITETQKNIRDWMFWNWKQLLYTPATTEKEECKKEMKRKWNINNTIGVVCYLPFKWNKSEWYIFFCIANSKIICWKCGNYKEEALGYVHDYLKEVQKWDKNAKFATDMNISNDLSDYFVHVSTDEIEKITSNQNVVEWMANNFDILKYSFNDRYHFSMPAIYSLALKYLEESMERT